MTRFFTNAFDLSSTKYRWNAVRNWQCLAVGYVLYSVLIFGFPNILDLAYDGYWLTISSCLCSLWTFAFISNLLDQDIAKSIKNGCKILVISLLGIVIIGAFGANISESVSLFMGKSGISIPKTIIFYEIANVILPSLIGVVGASTEHMVRSYRLRGKNYIKNGNILSAEEIISRIYSPCIVRRFWKLSNDNMIKIYGSTKKILSECCLTDSRQLKEVKKVRAICHADVDSRPIGHTVGVGMIAVMATLTGAAYSLGSDLQKEDKLSLVDSMIFTILIVLFLGIILVMTSVNLQQKSSIIVSAIDDTLAETASSAKSSSQLQ